MAYPLPDAMPTLGNTMHWGNETDNYMAHMATINTLPNGEILEIRYVEQLGLYAVVYQINKGVVESIHYFAGD